MLYLARFVLGIASGAICVTAPIFITEIAEEDVRGKLGMLFQIQFTFGILFQFVLGKCILKHWLSMLLNIFEKCRALAGVALSDNRWHTRFRFLLRRLRSARKCIYCVSKSRSCSLKLKKFN